MIEELWCNVLLASATLLAVLVAVTWRARSDLDKRDKQAQPATIGEPGVMSPTELHALGISAGKCAPDSKPITKHVLSFDDRAFVLKNLLSPSECKQLLAAIAARRDQWFAATVTTKAFNSNAKYRNSDRVDLHSEALAQLLFDRIRPFLEAAAMQVLESESEEVRTRCFGIRASGTWRVKSLNPRLRFSRYDSGGHFGPHSDGSHENSEHERSMLTFLVYLNGEGVKGGCTNFLKDSGA